VTTDKELMIHPVLENNLVTLGIMLGTLILGHLALFVISRFIKKDHEQLVDDEAIIVRMMKPADIINQYNA
jgi:hypothetical protein